MVTKKQRYALFAVGLLLGAVVPAAGTALFTSEYQATEGVTYIADSGPAVTLGSTVKVKSGSAFTDANTVELETSKGNITMSSSGRTNATVDVYNGSWTNISSIEASSSSLTIQPEDKPKVTVGGDIETLNWSGSVSAAAVDDGEVDFRYGGTSGTSSVTVSKLPENTPLIAIDLDTGATLDTATANSKGVATFEMPNSEHNVDIKVQSDPPYVQSSSPRGGEYRSNRTVTLNATVADPDGGDVNVDVYFFNRTSGSFELQKSTTVASGTEVQTTVQAFEGTNEWYVGLESVSDGETRRSKNYTFSTSASIRVLDGSDMTLLDSTPVNWEVQSITSDYRASGTINDGLLDLSGAPEERLKISFNASGFEERTLTISDPSRERAAVLYPSGANSTYYQRFSLDDRTGQFAPSETVLVVEQNYDGGWKEIASQSFGAQNLVNITLKDGIDYRLSVRNDENDIRQLSLFEADKSLSTETIILTIEQLGVSQGSFGELGYNWDAYYQNPEDSSAFIRYTLATETKTAIDNFEIVIYEQGNESNEIYNNSFGLVESLVVTQPLTDGQANSTWILYWSGKVGDEDVEGRRALGEFKTPTGIPLSDFWKSVMSLGMLVVVGGLFGGIRADAGAVVIGLLGGMLWYLNFLPGAIAGGAVVAALSVAIFFKIRTSRRAV